MARRVEGERRSTCTAISLYCNAPLVLQISIGNWLPRRIRDDTFLACSTRTSPSALPPHCALIPASPDDLSPGDFRSKLHRGLLGRAGDWLIAQRGQALFHFRHRDGVRDIALEEDDDLLGHSCRDEDG